MVCSLVSSPPPLLEVQASVLSPLHYEIKPNKFQQSTEACRRPQAMSASNASISPKTESGSDSGSATSHNKYRVQRPPRRVRGRNHDSTTSRDILLFLIAFRILNALSIKTFFQPDEFFQSLEPAWEWTFGADSGAWITWASKNHRSSALLRLSDVERVRSGRTNFDQQFIRQYSLACTGCRLVYLGASDSPQMPMQIS